MANDYLYPLAGAKDVGVTLLSGHFVIGSSGAVASTSAKGFSVVKTATETGRYTITLNSPYKGFLGCVVSVEGASDTAFGNSAGIFSALRNVSVGSPNKSLDIQLMTGAGADANPAADFKIHVMIWVKNSTV